MSIGPPFGNGNPPRWAPASGVALPSTLFWLVIALTGVGCAEGTAPPPDTGPADPTDVADIAEPADTTTDTAEWPVDAADTETPEDVCEPCCARQSRCVDESTVETCLADGGGWGQQSTCGDGQHCVAGGCQPKPICEPGARRCRDANTVLVCRESGMSERIKNCESGQVCIDGRCRHGSPNGAACQADGDCAGGVCLCAGSKAGLCGAGVQPVCAAPCAQGGCGNDAVCLRAARVPGVNRDVCVPACVQGACSQSALSCYTLPTLSSDGPTWQRGCLFDGAKEAGETCAQNDARCIGGRCLRDFFHVDVCLPACQGDCPSGMACVELKEGSFSCSPLCGDGSLDSGEPCPLEADQDSNQTTCAALSTREGGLERVCDSL